MALPIACAYSQTKTGLSMLLQYFSIQGMSGYIFE